MRPSNDSKTPVDFVSKADQQRLQRQEINNKWNAFANWATPKVNRVNEVVTPIIAGTPIGQVLDPRDGLIKRGLDVAH